MAFKNNSNLGPPSKDGTKMGTPTPVDRRKATPKGKTKGRTGGVAPLPKIGGSGKSKGIKS